MKQLITQLYELPLFVYFAMIFAAVVIWTALSCKIKNKKLWRGLNAVALFGTLVAIVFATLALRDYKDVGYSLVPFYSVQLAKEAPDIYSEVALNSIMFLPVGLTMPFVFNEKVRHPALASVLFSVAFSALIEVCQYTLRLGYAEIDDVIFNTIGAAVGTVSFLFTNRMLNEGKHNQ